MEDQVNGEKGQLREERVSQGEMEAFRQDDGEVKRKEIKGKGRQDERIEMIARGR